MKRGILMKKFYTAVLNGWKTINLVIEYCYNRFENHYFSVNKKKLL